MANLEQLEQGAATATGDQIEVAGLFEPKGLKGKQITGMVAGSVIGDTIGGHVGDDIGTILGGAVGTAAGSDDGQLRFVVALSQTKVYVLRPSSWDSLHKEEQQVIATFDRATVHV